MLGAVTLANPVTIDTDATNNSGDITIGTVTGSSQNFAMETGNNIAAVSYTHLTLPTSDLV